MLQQFFNFLEPHISLSEDRKNLIRNKCHVEQLGKGDVFVEAGKVSRKAGFILSGVMRYYFIDKFGKEITTMFVKENEFVARLSSFFDFLPSTRTIEAEVSSVVVTITYEHYQHIVGQIPEFHQLVGQTATNFLTQESERQRLYIDHLGAERYKLFLGHFPTISSKIALGHIASFLGMSAPTLSRIRRRMKSENPTTFM
ncbi:MAG: CRP-like cAMP-binding protein [Patiriisocius sp.]|jgi:CRP-like cAMP-binding protein